MIQEEQSAKSFRTAVTAVWAQCWQERHRQQARRKQRNWVAARQLGASGA
jgi:hypothetical protein